MKGSHGILNATFDPLCLGEERRPQRTVLMCDAVSLATFDSMCLGEETHTNCVVKGIAFSFVMY